MWEKIFPILRIMVTWRLDRAQGCKRKLLKYKLVLGL